MGKWNGSYLSKFVVDEPFDECWFSNEGIPHHHHCALEGHFHCCSLDDANWRKKMVHWQLFTAHSELNFALHSVSSTSAGHTQETNSTVWSPSEIRIHNISPGKSRKYPLKIINGWKFENHLLLLQLLTNYYCSLCIYLRGFEECSFVHYFTH